MSSKDFAARKEQDAIWSNEDRHCERSEAIQGKQGALRFLDRHVASLLAIPPERALP